MSSGDFNPKKVTPVDGVRFDDVWAVGEHVVACTDLAMLGPSRLFAHVGRHPDLLYADLPWSSSVAQGFRKAAGTGPAPFGQWKRLLTGVVEAAALTSGCAFIELSRLDDATRPLEELLGTFNLRSDEWYPITYGAADGKVYRVAGDDHPHPFLERQTWTDRLTYREHDSVFREVVHSCTQPGQVVTDTCLGYGLMADAAATLDRRCLATELSPTRVSYALARLQDLTGLTARRIGSLA